MFIGRGATPLRLRSKERNGSGVLKLKLDSAPSNGDVASGCALPINIALLTE